MIITPSYIMQEEVESNIAFQVDYKRDICEKFDEKFVDKYSLRDWEYGLAVFHGDFKGTDVVLDIGGACSFIMVYLSKFFQKGYIVDAAYEGIPAKWYDDWFKMVMQFDIFKNKVEVITQNARLLPFEDNFFDKVITFSAFEHFLDDDDTLCCKEIHRVLKDDGLFLGTVDFNPAMEYPRPVEHPTARVYTYESFIRRIVDPTGLKLFGKSRWPPELIPGKVDYIACPLFFKMVKK